MATASFCSRVPQWLLPFAGRLTLLVHVPPQVARKHSLDVPPPPPRLVRHLPNLVRRGQVRVSCKFAALQPQVWDSGRSRSACSCKPWRCPKGGVFAQCQLLRCLSREHPCKPPPYGSGHDPFKTASGVQNAGPWDPWLPGVGNSRLFAQHRHSTRCALKDLLIRSWW